jgi:acyl carrier protein
VLADPGEPGVDPEELWSLPCAVDVECGPDAADSFDAVLRAPANGRRPRPVRLASRAAGDPDWRRLANRPAEAGSVARLLPRLVRAVRRRLPEHMVPSAVIALDALPILPSGKLDRSQLPAPDSTRPKVDAAYLPPQTDVERLVAELWSEVLGVERVGVRDNFFELGGHSLIATQLMARMRDALQLDLPLRMLFESTTLGDLAAAVEEALLREIEAIPDEEAERQLHEATTGGTGTR